MLRYKGREVCCVPLPAVAQAGGGVVHDYCRYTVHAHAGESTAMGQDRGERGGEQRAVKGEEKQWAREGFWQAHLAYKGIRKRGIIHNSADW